MSTRRRRRVRIAAAGAAAVVTAGVATMATLGLGGRGGDPPRSGRSGPAATATVTRQTLVQAVTLAGNLNYGGVIPVTSAAAGTVTWLPDPGVVVHRGEAVLRADDRPVVLLYGALPMYRSLAEHATGADVRQLEQNLSALGYRGFTVDNEFSSATTTAVKRWQKSLGLTETGTVDRDRVVYAAGAIRIAQRLVRVGGNATGDVLSFTGTTRVATVSASPGEAGWAVQGAKVTVTLPGGATVAGEVSGATGPSEPAGGQPAEGRAPNGPAGAGSATVTVTVAIADQQALGNLAATPVDVRYVAAEHKDVLTVPVNALLALAEGGYGLEVVDDGHSRIVPVQVGMFADGRVEVTADGLADGATIGIPQ